MARYKEYIFVFSCYIDLIFLEFIKRRKYEIEIAKYDRDNTTASKLLNKLDQLVTFLFLHYSKQMKSPRAS